MKNMLRTFQVFLLITIFASNIQAQSKKVKKWQDAIDNLNKTEFIGTYKEYKERIETGISDSKLSQDNLDEKDIDIIKSGYIESKLRFDNMFDAIKADFTNKKMRKYISNKPEHYFKGFRYDMDQGLNFYRNNCERYIHKFTSPEVAAFGLTEITLLLGLIEKFGGIISNHIDKMNKISGEYLENHFISKLRLKNWDTY